VRQITEPDSELGQELNVEVALGWDHRLWNLETYGDRHGKRRLRRSLRFIGKPPVRVELGQISPELEAELKRRPGKGRHKQSRVDSPAFYYLTSSREFGRLKFFPFYLALAFLIA
jgi:hypothetical protein